MIDVTVTENPLVVATNKKSRAEFIRHLKNKIAELAPDTSTDAGRKAIRSLAADITRSKTAIVKAVNAHTETMRQQVKEINAERDNIETEIAALAVLARKPLTDYEAAEDERQRVRTETINAIKSAHAQATMTGTADAMEEKIAYLKQIELPEDIYGAITAAAKAEVLKQIELCEKSIADYRQAEADRAELEELRQLKADREAKEAEALKQTQAAEEKKRADKAAADKAEDDRLAAQKAEEERQAEHARWIKETEERAAQAERNRIKSEFDEKLRKAEQEAADAKAENDRIAAAKKQEAEDKAKREADIAHASKILGEVKDAIMALGFDEEPAKQIVRGIKAGKVPHLSIQF